ncbi:unnamed protein product [Mytilus edulis]|uniref:Uncharacterized protein n=1 Tax=Mytilus edulis TaxID=6550 RepID=A0A8S3VCE5_MYTED|nr:unnamed protein product [Mytilus edulis]
MNEYINLKINSPHRYQEESDKPLVSGRIRKYTPKAKDIFEENVCGYYKVLSEIRTSIIDGSLKYLDQYSENAEVLKEVRQVLLEGLEKYHEQSKEFREYLLMQTTTDSINELYAFKVVNQATEHKVRYGLKFIDERTAELNQLTQDSHDSKTSQLSHHSQASQSSHHSKTSQSSHHSKTSQSSHHSKTSQSSHHSKASQSSHHNREGDRKRRADKKKQAQQQQTEQTAVDN